MSVLKRLGYLLLSVYELRSSGFVCYRGFSSIYLGNLFTVCEPQLGKDQVLARLRASLFRDLLETFKIIVRRNGDYSWFGGQSGFNCWAERYRGKEISKPRLVATAETVQLVRLACKQHRLNAAETQLFAAFLFGKLIPEHACS